MSIPQRLVDELLVKCGRRCCVCRRFEPLHLHVHHIVEQADGGGDDADNLIAVCVTCHSDVHTRTQLTRRFTVAELKGHRDALITAVSKGTLPQQAVGADTVALLIDSVVSRFSGQAPAATVNAEALSAGALKLMLSALSDGVVADLSDSMSSSTTADEIREMSRNKRYLDELRDRGRARHAGGILYCLTDEGFILGDQVLAASQVDATSPK